MSQLETYITQNEERFLEDLKGWLRIPSISTLPEHAKDVQRAAEYAAEQLKQGDLENVEVIKTQGHPLVYGEWLKAADKPTILCYGHYDVQPVDPVDLWQSPPFEPTVRAGNIHCRGACDDKGQTMMIFKALEALMKTQGELPVNIKVLIEGEEEAGGASIEHYVKTYPERLRCDAILICDTHMPSSEIPALVIGMRGMVYTEVEVIGAKGDLHSGTYGGVAPNPLHALAIIISKLKDEDGHIHVPGLYDKMRQPTETEQKFWQQDPLHLNEAFKQEMGVSQLSGEPEYPPLQRATARPTLEVHGIVGGFVAEGAKTVIPARAKAKISLRLPPELKASEVYPLFEQAVKQVAPKDVKVSVTQLHSGDGLLVSTEAPVIQAAIEALQQSYGRKPVFVRGGGSIPIASLFDQILQAPLVFMGFGLPDDNLHAPNEKYSLAQFYKGIRTIAEFLQRVH
ncbi:dipeptidase [Ktedonosporobacter rubrisoli]|uniref:Dipeptidase n=1 Tax=Ktedonosporobacter rubrisoli TaxID=2509675 RepID=A0A4V0YZI4_KTERU|nr:dipeptidase [Ktedonosporobacter rubrisoli]QBD79831.1 dipeptidase [Ktedonosporobacter rubrisoli]